MAFTKRYADRIGGGLRPEDIAQTVIEKTFNRERKWDPEKGELLPWLFWQVKSEISNLSSSLAIQSEQPLRSPNIEDVEDDDDIYAQQHGIETPDNIFSSANFPLPEEALLRKEYIQQREAAIWAAAEGDPALEQLIEAIIQLSETKPQELEAYLNKPVKEVYNLLRRLRRRIESQAQK